MEIKYYGQDKETDRAVEKLISREVLYCQSALVDELLKQEGGDGGLDGLSYDDVQNLYPDTESMDAAECNKYCNDHGIPCEGFEDIDRWREAVRDGAEVQEIFEWWLITTWAANHLDEIGEPLLVTDYGTWWGRTCTGQSIALDPTFYEIYAKINT